MGGGASMYGDDEEYSKLKQEMPNYCVDGDLTEEQALLLRSSWSVIINNEAAYYIATKNLNKNDFPYQSCLEFFGKSFYDKFFELNPDVSDMSNQQRALAESVNMILLVCTDKQLFTEKMEFLADIHYKKGISSIEYTPFGQALFSTLEKFLGSEVYNEQLSAAWITAYSMIVRVMIKKIVDVESKGFKSQSIDHNDSTKVASHAKVITSHQEPQSVRRGSTLSATLAKAVSLPKIT